MWSMPPAKKIKLGHVHGHTSKPKRFDFAGISKRNAKGKKKHRIKSLLLPESEKDRPITPLTAPSAYYLQYGPSPDPFLAKTLKSGLTPISPLVTVPKSPWRLKVRMKIREQQIRDIEGFDTLMLRTAGAVESGLVGSEEIQPSDLRDIHPLFARERWETEEDLGLCRAFIPLGEGRAGVWSAWDNRVWTILTPVLALASKFVENSHMWIWWDTLVSGHITPILPNQRIRREQMRLNHRPPAESFEAIQALRQFQQGKFATLAQYVRFGISSAFVDPMTGLENEADPTIFSHGVTIPYLNTSQVEIIWVFIAREMLEPLLQDDLSESQRLQAQLFAAVVLVHELAHAMWACRLPELPEPVNYTDEPFVEDEPLQELGFSLENALLGGRLEPVTSYREKYWHLRGGPSLALIYLTPWPAYRVETGRGFALDGGPFDKKRRALLRHPVPMNWVSDIQQKEFWQYLVQQYGTTAIRPTNFTVIHTNSPYGIQVLGYHDENAYSFMPYENEFKQRRLAQASRIRELLNLNNKALIAERNIIRGLYPDPDQTPFWDLPMEGEFEDGGIVAADEERARQDFDKPKPARWNAVMRFLYDNRYLLRLDTMTQLLPATLFLAYINRILPPGQEQLSLEELEDCLVYCEYHDQFFNYEKLGVGLVRFHGKGDPAGVGDGDWPPCVTPLYGACIMDRPIQSTAGMAYIDEIVEAIRHNSKFFVSLGQVNNNMANKPDLAELRDYSEAQLFKNRWAAMLREQYSNGSMDVVTMGMFHDALRWCYTHEYLYVPGPPGVARRIDKGWVMKPPPKRVQDLQEKLQGLQEKMQKKTDKFDFVHRPGYVKVSGSTLAEG